LPERNFICSKEKVEAEGRDKVVGVVKARVWAAVGEKWVVLARVQAAIVFVPNAEKLYRINRENPATRPFVLSAKLP